MFSASHPQFKKKKKFLYAFQDMVNFVVALHQQGFAQKTEVTFHRTARTDSFHFVTRFQMLLWAC